MKKPTKLAAALALVLAALTFAGCTPEDKNALLGPENTWCKMDVSYTNASDTSKNCDLDVYCYYTETDTSEGNLELPAGITLVITCELDNNPVVSFLSKSTYIVKTFPKDKDASGLDTTDSSYSFQGSRLAWGGLYWAKEDLRQSKNQSKTNDVIKNRTNMEWDTLESAVKGQFSWKRLLANYLLS